LLVLCLLLFFQQLNSNNSNILVQDFLHLQLELFSLRLQQTLLTVMVNLSARLASRFLELLLLRKLNPKHFAQTLSKDLLVLKLLVLSSPTLISITNSHIFFLWELVQKSTASFLALVSEECMNSPGSMAQPTSATQTSAQHLFEALAVSL
jgi:hypothetical protein